MQSYTASGHPRASQLVIDKEPRRIEQEVFKMIVKMACELGYSERIQRKCVIHLSKVAPRPYKGSAFFTTMKINLDTETVRLYLTKKGVAAYSRDITIIDFLVHPFPVFQQDPTIAFCNAHYTLEAL